MECCDLIGQKFGRLTVIKKLKSNKRQQSVWKCKCSCGNITIIPRPNLKSGNTKSCGCLRNEAKKHGLYKHSLYPIWNAMVQRCCNFNNVNYPNYGGRGIKIYKQWKNDFKKFYDWAILNSWKKGLQIDRINNDGDYKPSNCRFVTSRKNNQNKRVSLERKFPICVYPVGKKFQTIMKINGKSKNLGTFLTLEKASEAYQKECKRISA